MNEADKQARDAYLCILFMIAQFLQVFFTYFCSRLKSLLVYEVNSGRSGESGEEESGVERSREE